MILHAGHPTLDPSPEGRETGRALHQSGFWKPTTSTATPSMKAALELPSTEEEGRVRCIDGPEQTQALARCSHIGGAKDNYGVYLCVNCAK